MAANYDYAFDWLRERPLGDYHRLEGYLFRTYKTAPATRAAVLRRRGGLLRGPDWGWPRWAPACSRRGWDWPLLAARCSSA